MKKSVAVLLLFVPSLAFGGSEDLWEIEKRLTSIEMQLATLDLSTTTINGDVYDLQQETAHHLAELDTRLTTIEIEIESCRSGLRDLQGQVNRLFLYRPPGIRRGK